MPIRIRPTFLRPLHRESDGWFDLFHCPLRDGTLGILQCDYDPAIVAEARQAFMTAMNTSAPAPGNTLPPIPSFPATLRGRILVRRDAGAETTATFALPDAHAMIDRLPGGTWLLANPRLGRERKNGRFLSARGELLNSVGLGDAIRHMQSDDTRNIWVAYFDEGVFGGYDAVTPEDSYGTAGLNRFDTQGRLAWSHSQSGPHPTISDAYALAVTANGAFIRPYTDFPTIRVTLDGEVRAWRHRGRRSVPGAFHIAVEEPYVVVIGGYDRSSSLCALLRLEEDALTLRDDITVEGTENAIATYTRGGDIHFFTREEWLRTSVRDIAQGLGITI